MKQQPMMQDLPSMAIRRPVLIVVLNLLIIIAGIAAIAGVEVRVALNQYVHKVKREMHVLWSNLDQA